MRRIHRSVGRVGLGARAVTVVSVMAVALLGMVTPASAAPRVVSVTVGAQSNTLSAGAASSATFGITVAKGTTFSLTANLSVTGLSSLAGVSTSFDSSTLTWGSFLPAGTTRTAILTVNTTAAAVAGSTSFTVRAERQNNSGDFAVGSGTLTILPAGDQTISFGPLPDRNLGDPDFTVSAVASSGLPVSFAATGGACSLLGDGVTVHLDAAGTCTITATQPGGTDGNNVTWNAAPPVQQSFEIFDLSSGGIDLYATTGSTTLAGQSVPVWGYGLSSGAASAPGGPTITVDQDDVVTIRLHNALGERTALLIQGQGMVPDLTGVASGSIKAYTFTASRPGTYIYEAGLLPNAQHQVAMGLYGALVVRPANVTQAYDDAGTAFNDEAVLLMSEIDPALNNLANPSTFDMRKFNPRYFLINGAVYPDTQPIGTAPGNRVLLRYVNAGTQYHSMGVMGTHQTMVALDGSLLQFSRRYVAETIGPGQTADAIVTIPNAAPDGGRLAVHEASLSLHNSNVAGFGGMLTFITVMANSSADDTTGPITSGVAFDGSTLSAVVDDSTTGASTIAAAEYYVDAGPGSGPATPITSGVPGGVTANVSQGSVSLTPGSHVLYVRGQDSAGNWGSVSSVLWTGDDTAGPITRDATLTPARAVNGSASVALHATGDDSTTGGSTIQAAEYFIGTTDPGVGFATGMVVNNPATVASLDAIIPALDIPALSGTYVVSIRSQDSAGNWGALTTINLVVDRDAPSTGAVLAAPNPNNGTISFTTDTQVLRVTATLSDGLTGSGISGGEGFIDTVGAPGTGFPMAAVDGTFGGATENVLADIPLATIRQLSIGNHTISVRAKDVAGNWGVVATTTLVIQPFTDLYFSTLDNALPTGVGGTADDADIYRWNGVTFARAWDASAVGLPGGADVDGYERIDATHFYLSFSGNTAVPGVGTVQDEDVVYYNAGTWSVYFDGTARGLTANNQDLDEISIAGGVLYFSNLGGSVPGVGTPNDDADIYSWSGTAFARVWDASSGTPAAPLAAGANVDGLQVVDATHFYLSFSGGTTAVPGLGNVQDEDVVYYNAGTWSVYFDGTARGLTAAAQDLDAIDVP